MSNLAQYRAVIVLFSLGLLFVVSQVVGDGKTPGVLDTVAQSAVHRLQSHGDQGADSSTANYELAVSEEYPDEAEPGDEAESADSSAPAAEHASNAWALDSGSGQAEPEPAAEEAPAPAVVIIHK